ncbi:ribonuclease H-like domain-containing protein, partial [Delphinella strobiligena]
QPDTDGESIDSERRRTKSICNIGLPGNQQTFEKDGKKVGVVDYLKETYKKIHITNEDSICVNLGSEAQPSWFLAEHLHILPYQLYKTKLDASEVAEMIKHACRSPDENRGLIMEEGLPSIGITATLPRVLAQINMQISRTMVEVPAFAMKMPTILCQTRRPPRPQSGPPRPQEPNKLQISNSAAFGYHWEMTKNKPMKTERKYDSRTYLIRMDPDSGYSAVQQIVGEFNSEIPSYGFGKVELTQGNSMRLPAIHKNIAQGIEGIKGGLEAAAKARADLVVLLLPSSGSSHAPIYRYFKSQADQVYGFKTVCMAEDKLKKGGLNKANLKPGCLRYYMSGIALKLNLKLGNWNWETGGDQGEIRNYIWNNQGGRLNTLVLGADVTHPGPGSVEGCPSVAAVVGNVDLVCGRMPGSMRYQAGRVEMIEKLGEMVEERLRDWNGEIRRKRIYGQYDLPMRIIYYRDGVSESQYSAVKALEIPQIKAAWQRARTKALAQGSTGLVVPKDLEVTCVLVSKRHNTRFYPSPQDHPLRDTDTPRAKGKGNLKPGVVIESVVTSPYWHDFYLNSHFGLQGTVRPCHYIVIEDDHKTSAADIQRLTFLLCHMYQRAMCSVSYATPTYYADRLCERGRHYLTKFFDGGVDVRNMSAAVVKKTLEEHWHRGDRNRERANPWHPDLDGTMFWL